MSKDLNELIDTITDMKTAEKKASKIRDIVPIEEWVNSSYYVGDGVLNLYPFWKQHLIDIFNNKTRINEIIVDGSLGTGKTTFANVVLLRLLYELSCYSNVPALFNLMASSKMMFAYFNLNLKQAEITGYGQLKEMIDRSPYFQENFPRDVRNSSAIKFPQANMMVRFASNERTYHRN